MQIKNIIKTVVDIAHKYQEKLENKNILFIYLEHSSQKINYIETKFLSIFQGNIQIISINYVLITK